MDLGSLVISSEAVEMQLSNPVTNEPMFVDEKPVALLMVGMDSEEWRKADRKITNRRLKVQKGGRNVKITAEELEFENQEKTLACVVGFKNIIVNGQPLEFSTENVRELFKNLPWLKRQAEDFIYDEANFIKA